MQNERKPTVARGREGLDGPSSPRGRADGGEGRLAIHVELPGARQTQERRRAEDATGEGVVSRLHFAEGFLHGESPVMAALCRELGPMARADIPVLLVGETGTGKELVARTVHLSSSRAARSFVAVNCAAIPADLLEPEMFGIEKGVATGVERRMGKLEAAHGGTLFLDEIGEMSSGLQAKLLRALQEKEVQPVGGAARAVDVRVVSATNADIALRIEKGRFRRDLYYRLAGVVLRIPSLRERPEDIPVLTEAFLRRYAAEAGKHRIGLTLRALGLLVSYPWPGNVRELQNELRRLAHLSTEGAVIDADALSPGIRVPRRDGLKPGLSPRESVELAPRIAELERTLIEEALRRTLGNRSRAARLLGISRNTLADKIKRLGVEEP